MRFIHLSDLHIGKRLYEVSLIEDQRYILAQILDIIVEEKIEGVFIAGDIYDKSVPSAESVALFDWFLNDLVNRKLKIFIIDGNHDCAQRIAFGAGILYHKDVFIAPVYDGNVSKVSLHDEYGDIDVFLLPFLKPAIVRNALSKVSSDNDIKIESYHDALFEATSRIEVDSLKRNIILSHQFVVGAVTCDSEEISVGGTEQVGANCYDKFDYVALGHIHTPQIINDNENIRYCGTPLKYSFSEASKDKSVTIVDVFEKGNIKISTIPLKPRIDMRVIRGSYDEVTHMAAKCDNKQILDYVSIKLTDEEDIVDGIYKLRSFYPNIMTLSYDNLRSSNEQEIYIDEEYIKKSEIEIFEELYYMQNNKELDDNQKDYMKDLIENINEKDR